jgi:uncharacterized protein YabE (DUF348 family)
MKHNYFGDSLRLGWALVSAILAVAVIWTVSQVMAAPAADAPQTDRLVSIYDRGVERAIITKAATVADVLQDAKITVDPADIVEPARTEKLVAKNYHVNIYRARPVVVTDGSTRLRVMTAEQSPRQIAAAAKLTLYDEDITKVERVDDVIGDGGAGLKLIIDRATPFSFVLYGKKIDAHSQAKTVGEMLTEKNVKLAAQDGTSLPLSTPLVAGMTVSVWRNGVQTVTQEEEVVMPVRQVKNADQPVGFKQVQTAGKPGKKQVTYELDLQNGVEVSRKVIQSVVSAQPLEQVEIIGSKGSYTTPSENESITWGYLMSQGFSREQTAGIMGNLRQENGFKTSGDGLAQWTGGRKAALMSRADPYSIYTQLDFLMYEFNTGYSKVQTNIKASSSVDQALVVFQNQFEACGVCHQDARLQFAYNILASH